MEGREEAREREDSLHFDLKHKKSRHNDFRSSIFSTPTKERSTPFSRGGVAAAAAGPPSFLAAMSGRRNGSQDETVTEGRNADPEAVRAAMEMDASSSGNVRERGGDDGGARGGGNVAGGGGGMVVGGGEGGAGEEAGPDADGGGKDGGGADAANHYKGKHWSSAAAACVLGGYPPSPKAAAAVAARAATAGGGEGGHNRRNGSGGGGGGGGGGSGGGVFSYSGGTPRMFAASIARQDNGDVDGGKAAAAAAAAQAGQGFAATAAATAAVVAAAAPAPPPAEKERKPPRPKSVWERGGAAPAPKTVWRQLIDPPRGGETGGRDVDGGTRSSRWNRGTGAADNEGEVNGEDTAGDGGRAAPGPTKDPSAFIQNRNDGCLACCRRSGDGGSGGRNKHTSNRARCRPLSCNPKSSSCNGSGGGGEAPPAISRDDRRRRRNPSGSGWNSDDPNATSGGRSGGGSGIKASGVFLGVGLVLEVAATLWAFQQAAQAGALSGDPDGTAGIAIAALAVALTGEVVEAAVGVACLKSPSRGGGGGGGGGGGPALLAGAAAIQALGAVAVATVLVLFLPSFAAAAAGGDDDGADDANPSATRDRDAEEEAWPVWAAAATAIVGVVLEAVPAGLDRAAANLPFLAAFGHALLWLGIAALEVLVAVFLVREAGDQSATAAAAAAAGGQRETLAAALEGGEMIGVVVVEAVALLALGAARGLWTRARLLLAVKGQEGPSRRRSSHFARFDSV